MYTREEIAFALAWLHEDNFIPGSERHSSLILSYPGGAASANEVFSQEVIEYVHQAQKLSLGPFNLDDFMLIYETFEGASGSSSAAFFKAKKLLKKAVSFDQLFLAYMLTRWAFINRARLGYDSFMISEFSEIYWSLQNAILAQMVKKFPQESLEKFKEGTHLEIFSSRQESDLFTSPSLDRVNLEPESVLVVAAPLELSLPLADFHVMIFGELAKAFGLSRNCPEIIAFKAGNLGVRSLDLHSHSYKVLTGKQATPEFVQTLTTLTKEHTKGIPGSPLWVWSEALNLALRSAASL